MLDHFGELVLPLQYGIEVDQTSSAINGAHLFRVSASGFCLDVAWLARSEVLNLSARSHCCSLGLRPQQHGWNCHGCGRVVFSSAFSLVYSYGDHSKVADLQEWLRGYSAAFGDRLSREFLVVDLSERLIELRRELLQKQDLQELVERLFA